MNDAGLKGTVDSFWDAQCGNTTTAVEAMTAIKLNVTDYYNENIRRCPVFKLSSSAVRASEPTDSTTPQA
jgi:hypothetical protein